MYISVSAKSRLEWYYVSRLLLAISRVLDRLRMAQSALDSHVRYTHTMRRSLVGVIASEESVNLNYRDVGFEGSQCATRLP